MGNAKQIAGKTVAWLKLMSLLYVGITESEGLQFVDYEKLTAADAKTIVSQVESSNDFVMLVDDHNKFEIRRKDGRKLFEFQGNDELRDHFTIAQDKEEYAMHNPLYEDALAIIHGEKYKETIDERTNKTVSFEVIKDESADFTQKIEGVRDILGLFKVLSNGTLTLMGDAAKIDREQGLTEAFENGTTMRLFDFDLNKYVEGTPSDILFEAFRKVGLNDKEICEILRIDEPRELETQEGDGVSIGNEFTKTIHIYADSTLDGVVRSGNKLIVEDENAIKDASGVELLAYLETEINCIDSLSMDERAAMIDELVNGNYLESQLKELYDFILAAHEGKARRPLEHYTKKVKAIKEARIIGKGYSRKEVSELSEEQVIEILTAQSEALVDESDKLMEQSIKNSKNIEKLYLKGKNSKEVNEELYHQRVTKIEEKSDAKFAEAIEVSDDVRIVKLFKIAQRAAKGMEEKIYQDAMRGDEAFGSSGSELIIFNADGMRVDTNYGATSQAPFETREITEDEYNEEGVKIRKSAASGVTEKMFFEDGETVKSDDMDQVHPPYDSVNDSNEAYVENARGEELDDDEETWIFEGHDL